MKKVKILILGGTSFLGYNFSKILSHNNEVLTTYRKKFECFKTIKIEKYKKPKKKFDIEKDQISALKFNPDIIINCLGNTKNYNNHKFNQTKSLKIFQSF